MKLNHPSILANSVLAAALAGAGFGAAAQAQTSPRTASQAAPAASASEQQPLSDHDRDFIKKAARAGKAEIQASKMALQKASDPAVKEFAQRMVEDHTKASEKLKQIAQSNGAKLPSELPVHEKSKLALLEHADHGGFDQKYSSNFGVDAHRKAIKLFRDEAKEGRNPQLKQFAQETVGTLEQHLRMAQNMEAKVRSDHKELRAAGAPPQSHTGAAAK